MPRRFVLATVLCLSLIAPAFAAERWSGDGISWQTPEGWTQKKESTEFRFAQIDLGDNLLLVVSRFPGDVGGNLANVNRWRGQLQLPPIKADELDKVTKKVQAGDTTAILTDFTNAAGDQRMLGAIVPDEKGKQTWFFKVTGPAKAVGGQTEKFQKFVESVKLEAGK
jgi:hypothetical protein